ncbi:MAG TPA: hypothetical protein VFJ85_03345 [Acidimicrobiales bacterium]|nr:hypothetical protein [Acidimicrobiales bacterium]
MRFSFEIDDAAPGGRRDTIGPAESAVPQPAEGAIDAGPAPGHLLVAAGATEPGLEVHSDARPGGSPSPDLLAAVAAAGGSNGSATTAPAVGADAIDAGGAPI